MQKYLYFIIFILLKTGLFAQFQAGSGPIDIPNLFPASPEASTLGKYGDIPVNLSIGTINHSIPIYTIKENGFELPISLSYTYTGLLVDEIPGITGLGWSLNAGGIITRQLRGRPDEEPNGYIGTNQMGKKWVIPYVNNQLSSIDQNTFKENAASGIWDTQPDKFMISVGNVQASFYFDENKNAVIKPYKPYNIEVINDDFNQGIKVTDDNGIQYFFQATEITKRIPPIGINDLLSTPVTGYISSWKLTKIELPNHRSIHLNYTGYYHTQETISQTYTKPIGSSGCANNLRSSRARYSISSKIIESISFSLGTIEFATTRPNITELNQYLASLDNIKVKDTFGKEIFNYSLQYDSATKTKKLLTGITINNDISNRYQFEYNGAASDNILFYKQDFWGYANANNTGKLVNIDDLYGPRKPSFEDCSKGALQKIIYPTKGSTEFEYEQNTYDPGINGDEYDDFYDVGDSPCAISNSFYGAAASATGGDDFGANEFTITENTAAEITISVTKAATAGSVIAKIHEKNTADDAETACQSSSIGECNRSYPCSIAQLSYGGGFLQPGQELKNSFTKKVYLKAGTYSLSVSVRNAAPDGHVEGSVRVNVNRGNEIPVQARSRETGGIRIKTITSCPDTDPANCITKEYSYETADHISQGVLFRRRNLTTYEYGTTSSVSGGVQTCVFRSYSSSSNMPLGYNMGSHIIYKQVTEKFTSANGTNGTRKLTFGHNIPEPLVFPFPAKDDNAYKNGKTLKEEVADANGTVLKETVNHYDFDDNLNYAGRVYSVKVGQTGFIPTGPGIYAVDTEIFDASRNVDRLIQTSVTDHLNGSSINTQNFYRYNNPQGHLKEQETINSDLEKTITKYFYAYDFNTAIANSLSGLNRISSPIQTQLFEDQKLLNTQNTTYKNWGNNILLPEVIKTAKQTDPQEPRLMYYNYDDFGNPLAVSKEDGTHIIYVWGYQDIHPIAKIENATYTEVQPYEADLKAKANADNDNCRSANCKEQILKVALQELRNGLPKAMVTTYTYDPLIGVTSITDPKGYTTYYEYDNLNRLMHIRDAEGHIIDKFYYNYTDQLYTPLQISIASNPWMETGTNVVIKPSIEGGSDNFSYLWKVTKPGNVIEHYSTKDVNLQTGNTTGMTTITLTVKDKLTGIERTAGKSISVYHPLAATTNHPSQVDLYTTASFSAAPNGGSGNYSYSWTVRNTFTNHSFTSAQKSFSRAMGCYYYGNVAVTCVITDNVTQRSKTINTSLTVGEMKPRTATILKHPVSQNSTSETFDVSARLSDGSGNYSRQWYVNGVRQSGSSPRLRVSCSGPRSIEVKCVVTDNCIRQTATAIRTFTVNPSWCSSGGGGGNGDGPNPIDNSDNYNQ
ncbi:RHS repeat domain-containing protein [Aquimarina mytili]